MTTIRRFLLVCLFALLSTQISRAEVIRSFDAAVRLNDDTSLDVTETIEMDFENAQKHGIYRFIPITYDRNGGVYSLKVRIHGITQDGAEATYSESTQGRDLFLRIGDADRTISGAHTYVLRYTVQRAVNFFDGGEPEVYWNVTGNQWTFPMERVTARFSAPPNVPADKVRADCFVGVLGSTQRGTVSKERDALIFSAQNLAPGQGLSFVARLPKGSVTPPTALQNFLWFMRDWWALFVFPLVTAIGLYSTWLRVGRDEGSGGAIGVEWNPPKELSPAEVGTLIDERCDMADIVATVVDLAARGYLVIQEIDSQSFLFLSKKDYLFKRTLKPADDGLAPHERRFLVGLFGSERAGQEHVVALSSLKNRFYTHLPGIREAIYGALVGKQLFTSNPDSTRQGYFSLGFFMLFAAFVAFVFIGLLGTIAYALGLAISGFLVLASAGAMPAKTAEGSRLWRESKAFQRFVEMAEKDRIRVLAQEDPTIFGRLLPYAMVLGVADQWANAFSDLMTQPPDWYVGSSMNTFSTHMFVHNLGSGMNTMGNTFSSTPAPQSTAGSGGSGFSSGGGFSGGGFGGGGGGSW